MIVDNLKNRSLYEKLDPRFTAVFDFIEKAAAEDLGAGKYVLDGDDLFVLVQQYELGKEPQLFEAHRKYTDLQCLLLGNEKMEATNLKNCTVTDPYEESIDAAFLRCDGHKSTLELGEGDFAVFFPEDAHRPCLTLGESRTVKKIVAKISVK